MSSDLSAVMTVWNEVGSGGRAVAVAAALTLVAADPLAADRLELIDVVSDVPLNGGSAIAFSPDGAHLYVAGADKDAIVTLRRQASGTLELVDVDLSPDLFLATRIAVSPDGGHVYVRAEHALVRFDRRAASGDLRLVESLAFRSAELGGLWPSDLALDPEGRHLYVSGSSKNSRVPRSRSSSGSRAPARCA